MTKVELYRYDLTNGMAAQMAPILLGRPLEGVWHTGIVFNAVEYYFDGGVGIEKGPAGATRFGPPHRSELLGYTSKSAAEFESFNAEQILTNTFGPNSYNIMTRNCNHYTQEACQFLLGTDIPEDIRMLIPTVLQTPLGAMLAPLLSQMSSNGGGIGATPFGAGLGGVSSSCMSPSQNDVKGQSSHPVAAPQSNPRVTLDEETQESLDIYLALIVSDDGSSDSKKDTLGAIDRILSNIRTNPTNTQYQRISKTSTFFQSKIASPFECAVEILKLAGFKADGDTHLVFKGSLESLNVFIDSVQNSKDSL